MAGPLHESYAHMHEIWLKSGRFERTPLPFANRLELCLQTSRRHSVGYGECSREVCTRISQRLTNGRGVRPCPTAVCGTAAGTRRSPVGTLNMGIWAGTGEALAWYIASDVPSTPPSQGSNSGAHRESCSTHTDAFKHSCNNDSCNAPSTVRYCPPQSTSDQVAGTGLQL